MYPGNSYTTTGQLTKEFRVANAISKDHYLDAYSIAYSSLKSVKYIATSINPYELRQFRRHDRQACHQAMLNRNYYDETGKLVATNRHKAIEQQAPSLEEYIKTGGKADKLTVKEHKPIYKNINRILPGSLLIYNYRERFILNSTSGSEGGKPSYYISVTGTKYRANKCKLLLNNKGFQHI